MPVSYLPCIMPLVLIGVPLLCLIRGRRAFFVACVVSAAILAAVLLSVFVPGWIMGAKARDGDPAAKYEFARWTENHCEDLGSIILWPCTPDVLGGFTWLEKAAAQQSNGKCRKRVRTMNYRKTAVVLATFLLAGCASLPPPEPINSNSSMIAITVKTTTWFAVLPDRVYFVRLDGAPTSGLMPGEGVIQSNYAKGRYVYLLNAEPGRYRAVACRRVERMTPTRVYDTYFNLDILEMTEVTVIPGSVNFIGEYTVKESGFGNVKPWRMLPPTRAPIISYWGSLHEVTRDAEAEARFLAAAAEHFAETGWSSLIARNQGRQIPPSSADP